MKFFIFIKTGSHMRPLLFICILFFAFGCTGKSEEHITFQPITENEFNFPADTSFAIPHGKIWEERKHLFDSCMGSSYAANAIFMRAKDTFFVGSIVNMQSMKIIKRLNLTDSSLREIAAAFRFTTKPCYEKRAIDIPVDSFMNNKILFRIDSLNPKLNEELITAVKNSFQTEIETGDWVNMELTDFFGKVLDTTTNPVLLDYKKDLLTPGNMLLVRSSAVTEINFYFHIAKPMSTELMNQLSAKPVSINQPLFKATFYYIDPTSFKIKLNGFFQVIGQFMKCGIQ